MNALFTALEPAIVEIAGLFVAGLIAWAANTARQRFGLEIEEKHRDALHSAIMSGVQSALARGLSGQAAATHALEYIHDSVPDAVKRLKPAPRVLGSLIDGALRREDLFISFGSIQGDKPEDPAA
ncbi:hypothetical protein JYP51_09505 [Ponticoccus gilvus]|nr:hypothetical protein [Enemella evansiae]